MKDRTYKGIAIVAGMAILLWYGYSLRPEPAPQPPFGSTYTGERGFRGLDEKVVKAIIYREGMTEATVVFYGKNGKEITKSIPFSWEQKAQFEALIKQDSEKVKKGEAL